MAVVLILATWTVWAIATWGIGIALAPLVARDSRNQVRQRAELGIWVGLLALVALTVGLNFGSQVVGTLGLWVAISWIFAGLLLFIRWVFAARISISNGLRNSICRSNFMLPMIFALLGISGILAAWFAAAEPMDYDAGLYRMGLINYAAEYRVIPGLANLHSRFGFNSALGPLTAILENLVWQDNSFRLVTGFVFTLYLLSVVIRLLTLHKRTPGDFFIVLGWAFIVWVVLDDSGRWMASPAQDVIALITSLAAFGFLIDYVNPATRKPWLASAAILSATLSATIRPLGWSLVAVTAITIYFTSHWRMIRRNSGVASFSYLLPTLVVAFALGIVMMIRDAIISGWLLFPFSSLPLPLDWRTVSPKGDSLAVTWWGRAPFRKIEEASANGWLGPWLEDFALGREVRFFAVALIAGFIPLLWSSGRHAWSRSWSAIVLSAFPALVVSITWFLTAPDVRFGWAGLFALAAIPISFLLSRGAYPSWACRVIFVMLILLGGISNWRAGLFEQRGNKPIPTTLDVAGHEIQVLLGPPNEVVTVPGSLGDGTPVVYPRDGENCYMVFPLCLLPESGSNIERRGESIAEGFRVIR